MSNPSPPNCRIAEIPANQLTAAQADVITQLMSGRGRIPTPCNIWLPVTLTATEIKLAILYMAVHWHATYVFNAHAREARALGMTEEIIAALGAGKVPPLSDAPERRVYDMVSQFSSYDPAIQALGHAGVADLLALCGYFTAVCLATKLYRLK